MKHLPHALLLTLSIGLSLSTPNAYALNSLTQAAVSPTYTNTRQRLQTIIDKVMKQSHIVGLSIALVDDQTVVWAQGFGYANKAKRLKASPATLYRAGSISKLLTATAAMQLAEQGKLDIDQPLTRYIPQFAIKSRFADTSPITPRQLMTHHSGLPSEYLKAFLSAQAVDSFTQLVDKLPDEYTAFAPNLILSYSNLAVSLLGIAITNTCSVTFELCLQQHLIQPLGMADSEFASSASVAGLMAQEYSQGAPVPVSYLRDVPAGGLNSTVLDLSRFMRMVFADGVIDGKQILSAATLKEMLRPQNADVALDLEQRVGLAWFFGKTSTGETTAWHNGTIGHFNSHFSTIPRHKIGVVVLSNSDALNVGVDDIAGAALELMLAEKGVSPTSSITPAPKTPINPQALPGYYASEYLGLVRIAELKGQLHISLQGKTYLLNRQADGSARFSYPDLGGAVVLRREDISKHAVLVSDSPIGKLLLGEKLLSSPLPKIWQQRLGTYQLINKGKDIQVAPVIQLINKYGFLVLKAKGISDKVLLPYTDAEAIVAGLGRDLGITLHVETNGKQDVLRFSGYLAKRIK